MKVSLFWLKDWVDLPATLSVDDLAHRLTMAGFEVEAIHNPGTRLHGVVIAEVREVSKHPNADKLSLCRVWDGNQEFRVVCGAANVRAGIKVALATVGAQLPGGITIKRSKIRGEESEGMICSESELALADTSEGILVLSSDAPIGKPVAAILDTVLELNITPNRPDVLGHLGVAREIAAILGISLKPQAVRVAPTLSDPALSVQIQDADGCPVYLGRRLSGVSTAASPAWVQKRLQAVGITPKNLMIDATNYLMMDLGQPTHAFDVRALKGSQIVVRRAKNGEKLKTLDGSEHGLTQDDLLIADAQGPIALAGVMGGENSKIFDDTRDVILECAYFKPALIRMTKRRLGLQTDSAFRFERGVDPLGTEAAMERLTKFIIDWTAELNLPAPSVHPVVRERKATPALCEIDLDLAYVNTRLGQEIAEAEVVKLLTGLGLQILAQQKGQLKVRVPSARVDLLRPVDLVEEIARLYGYDRITASMPKFRQRPQHKQPLLLAYDRVAEVLRRRGFCEAVHYTFASPQDAERLGCGPEHPLAQQVAIRNPLAEDESRLRTSLLPGLLKAAAYNRNRDLSNLRLFEFNKVFLPAAKGGIPNEPLRLSGVLLGDRAPVMWGEASQPLDAFDVKAVVEDLLQLLPGPTMELLAFAAEQAASFRKALPFLHPGLSAVLLDPAEAASSSVGLLGMPGLRGWMGVLHPAAAARFELEATRVWVFELQGSLWVEATSQAKTFRPIPQFPAIRRDVALVVPENRPAGDVYKLIFSFKNGMIDHAELFDVYQGQQVPQGKKSLAFAIHYLSKERTLTHEEVDRVHAKLVERLEKELGAETRR